jgi:diguanylate cyclase (GGDEF)-like protein
MTRPRGEKDSFFDLLTGLPNRWRFEKRLQQIILRAEVRENGVGLALIEISGVKLANCMFGLTAGDALMREASEILQPLAPPGALVGRLDGNVFGVLLTDLEIDPTQDLAAVPYDLIEKPVTPMTQTCMAWAENTGKALSRIELKFEGHPVWIGVNIGVSFCPLDADNGPALLRKAYLALCDAAGYHTMLNVRRFSPEMVDITWEEFRMRMSGDL